MPQRQTYVQRSTRQSFRSPVTTGHNQDRSRQTVHNWKLCIMAETGQALLRLVRLRDCAMP